MKQAVNPFTACALSVQSGLASFAQTYTRHACMSVCMNGCGAFLLSCFICLFCERGGFACLSSWNTKGDFLYIGAVLEMLKYMRDLTLSREADEDYLTMLARLRLQIDHRADIDHESRELAHMPVELYSVSRLETSVYSEALALTDQASLRIMLSRDHGVQTKQSRFVQDKCNSCKPGSSIS